MPRSGALAIKLQSKSCRFFALESAHGENLRAADGKLRSFTTKIAARTFEVHDQQRVGGNGGPRTHKNRVNSPALAPVEQHSPQRAVSASNGTGPKVMHTVGVEPTTSDLAGRRSVVA